MAIQFFCSACGQAIEVDDNAANVAVTCPYCRKVIVAPAQTDLSKPPQPPVAEQADMALKPPRKRSVLGWIALACVVVSLICLAYTSVGFVKSMAGLDIQNPQSPEFQKAFAERLQSRSDLVASSLLGFCITPVIGAVCAIVALVTGAAPRWPAIVSLCLLGAMILFACAGIIFRQPAVAPGG